VNIQIEFLYQQKSGIEKKKERLTFNDVANWDKSLLRKVVISLMSESNLIRNIGLKEDLFF